MTPYWSGLTLKLITVHPRGDRLDQVPRRAGLLHAGSQCPGPKDAHRPTHPHLPKDNEEVNVHVKCLQAMLDAAIMVDPDNDHDDGIRGHELDHR
jgi:hypothetical protein